jgi:deoxyribonuclease V
MGAMKTQGSQRWDVSPREAVAIQNALRDQVIRTDQLGVVGHVAGVDVGFEQHNTITRAAVAVLDFPGLGLLDHGIHRQPTTFPYVPGLLSFREVPAILRALDTMETKPDLILVDGQGIAHPRRIGIASHLGLACGLPTIGVAKTRLIGTHDDIPDVKGAWRPLMDRDETIGAVLRTRAGVKPLYISIGHRVSLPTAIEYVMACVTRYRLPETTRWAHRLASGNIDQALRQAAQAPSR